MLLQVFQSNLAIVTPADLENVELNFRNISVQIRYGLGNIFKTQADVSDDHDEDH